MKAVIEIKNLSVVYDKNTPHELIVFDNFSISFGEGINVITGGNGSGKSTLLKVLLGTVPIKTGKIFVNGVDITKWSALQRTRLFSAVHQDTMLGTCPNLSIRDNFLLTDSKRWWSPFLHRWMLTESQKNSIKQTGLPLDSRGTTKINTLSGGQRQAIAVCLAFEKNRPILLLDEFTSALDKETEKNVMEFTVKQTEIHRATVLVVTHDAHIIKEYSNNFINF